MNNPYDQQPILDFFNYVHHANEICDLITDDPLFGRDSSYAYGVSLVTAKKILKKRNSLPGQIFTSVGQIDSVRGVGTDTMHDILFTLRNPKLTEDALLDFVNSHNSTTELQNAILDDPLSGWSYNRPYKMSRYEAEIIIREKKRSFKKKIESARTLRRLLGEYSMTLHNIFFTAWVKNFIPFDSIEEKPVLPVQNAQDLLKVFESLENFMKRVNFGG